MPKTKRLQTFYGSILDPLCKYVLKLEVVVTPYDSVGNNLARHVYTHYKGGSPSLKIMESKVITEFILYLLSASCL